MANIFWLNNSYFLARCDAVLDSDFDDDNFMIYCMDVSEPYQGHKSKDYGNHLPSGKEPRYNYEGQLL
mgnify:CR=1 FL=1|tara:strand:+ start:1201 stop:1404 length:204 start_codon:yes stop_codon:yes gene_type:complete